MRERPHGRSKYLKEQCRCDVCKEAQREYMRWWRGSERSGPSSREEEPEHGTRSRYNGYQCRCDACTEANRKYVREWAYARRNLLPWP